MRLIRPCLLIGFAVIYGHSAWAGEPAPGRMSVLIEPQPLREALTHLAEQVGIQIMRREEDAPADGMMAPRVAGELSAREALDRLLAHSGLTYEFLNEHTVRISRAAAPARTSKHADPLRVDEMGQEASRQEQGFGKEIRGVRNKADIQDTRNAGGIGVEEKRVALEEVVVTGSNIRGVAPVGSPVYVYSQEDIKKLGVGSVGDFLAAVPQNFTSNGLATLNSIGADSANNGQSATSVNLRGIGTEGTLVLINGHRAAPSALGDFVDVSMIPLSAIERVEIMPDSASATYGSDAVAGVINFILKDNYEGAETRVRNGWLASSGATDFNASQALGHAWSSGGALLSLDYEQRDPLLASSRSYAAMPSPYDLEPMKKSYSALVAAHQAATDWLTLRLDGFYAHTKTRNVQTTSRPTFTNDFTEPTYLINATADARISSTWAAELSASYGADRANQRFSQPGAHELFFGEYRAHVDTVDLKADGTVFALPGGSVKLALGGGARNEAYNQYDPSNVAAGFAPPHLDRKVYSSFMELNVPIVGAPNAIPAVQQLVLSLAERYEHYSDAGRTTDPKFGLLWEPLTGLSLRGSYSTSFNVAKFQQTLTIFNGMYTYNGPCPSRKCLIAEQYGNHTSYRPETSKSFNVGFEYRVPWVSGLKLAADYYHIDYRDKLGGPPADSVLLANPALFPGIVTANPSSAQIHALCAEHPPGCFIPPGPVPAEYLIDTRTTNLGVTKTRGLDFDLDYLWRMSKGEWRTELRLARIFSFENQLTAASPPFTGINRTGYPTATRLAVELGYSVAPVSINAHVSHVNGYLNDLVAPNEKVDQWTTVDLWMRVALDGWLGTFGNGTSVSLSARNVLNSTPPFVSRPAFPLGFDGNNANPDGRIVAAELTKQW